MFGALIIYFFPIDNLSVKFAKVLQILKNVEGKKIVASSYKTAITLLFNYLVNGIEENKLVMGSIYTYTGGMNLLEKQAALEEFRNDSTDAVLLMTKQSGGLGLTITEANTVVLIEDDWNREYLFLFLII